MIVPWVCMSFVSSFKDAEAPICFAESTPSNPTAPSPTTTTVEPGPRDVRFEERDAPKIFQSTDAIIRLRGAFDLWAWQLWWLVGVWQGVRWAKGEFRLDWVKQMTKPAAITAFFFLVLRYAQVDGLLTFGRSALLVDKWDFGAGRMINFAAVAVLAIRFRSVLRPLAIRPLVMLGQASLPVFCVHLLCVFFALTIMRSDPVIRDWKAIAVVLASLSAVLLTAKIATNRRAKAGAKRAAGAGLLSPRCQPKVKTTLADFEGLAQPPKTC
jgi:hypothetical protein